MIKNPTNKTPAAVALGKMAKDVPKRLSKAERQKRRDRMREMNKPK